MVVLGFVLVKTGCLKGMGEPVELGSFFLGMSLFASIGFIAFRCRVWSDGCGAFLRGRPASLQPGPSAGRVLCNSVQSFLAIASVCVVALVTALWYQGRLDLVVQALEFIVGKLGKLVNALLQ